MPKFNCCWHSIEFWKSMIRMYSDLKLKYSLLHDSSFLCFNCHRKRRGWGQLIRRLWLSTTICYESATSVFCSVSVLFSHCTAVYPPKRDDILLWLQNLLVVGARLSYLNVCGKLRQEPPKMAWHFAYTFPSYNMCERVSCYPVSVEKLHHFRAKLLPPLSDPGRERVVISFSSHKQRKNTPAKLNATAELIGLIFALAWLWPISLCDLCRDIKKKSWQEIFDGFMTNCHVRYVKNSCKRQLHVVRSSISHQVGQSLWSCQVTWLHACVRVQPWRMIKCVCFSLARLSWVSQSRTVVPLTFQPNVLFDADTEDGDLETRRRGEGFSTSNKKHGVKETIVHWEVSPHSGFVTG